MRHEPDNRYDENAVEVVLEISGAKLGHVPKELAPKYLKLIQGGKIASVKLKSAERHGDDVKISINVSYVEDDLKIELLAKSKLSTSARGLPAVPGVYAIKNIKTARTYIGSSTNVRDRLKAHIKDLSNEVHFNNLLQNDFSNYGPDSFQATLLTECRAWEVKIRERDHVQSSLRSFASLYNKTSDGDGRKPWGDGTKRGSISDRTAGYYQVEAVREKQREFETKHLNPLIEKIEAIEEALIALQAGMMTKIFGETVRYDMQRAKYRVVTKLTLSSTNDVRALIGRHASQGCSILYTESAMQQGLTI